MKSFVCSITILSLLLFHLLPTPLAWAQETDNLQTASSKATPSPAKNPETPDEHAISTLDTLLPSDVNKDTPNIASAFTSFLSKIFTSIGELFGFNVQDQTMFAATAKQQYQAQFPKEFSREQENQLKVNKVDLLGQTADQLGGKNNQNGVYPALFPQEIKQSVKNVREAEAIYEINYPQGVQPITNP